MMRIETDPDKRDVEFLDDRILEFNIRTSGYTDGMVLAILERDGEGNVVAGLYGWTWGGTCEIENLWVRDDLRGRGRGAAMLAEAEAEAAKRGCTQVVLDTHTFQAPAFYERFGYRECGRVRDYPRGFDKILYVKQLGE